MTWWYARSGTATVEDASIALDMARNPGHRIRRSRINRRFVDRFYFESALPIGVLLNLGDPASVYSPDFTAPGPLNARKAITVHDLAWLVRPEFTPAPLRNFLNSVVPRAIAGAELLFTVSETSRRDIIDRFEVNPERVIVAPNAVTQALLSPTHDEKADMTSVNVPAGFLLMAGTIEPRKNHLHVMQALDRIADAPPLVVVGPQGWANQEIREAISARERTGQVILLGDVKDSQLAELYARCTAVICASWYEGFDLPLVESLAAGAAVAASDIPVHREVGGQFLDFFDPGDTESIANGIILALNRGRPAGSRLNEQRQWAGRYSWDSSASIVHRAITINL